MPADEGVGERGVVAPSGVMNRTGDHSVMITDGLPDSGETKMVAEREQRAIDVTRAGTILGWSVHHGAITAWVEPEHLTRRLDDDAHLVVVFATRETGSVRGRTNLNGMIVDAGSGGISNTAHHARGATPIRRCVGPSRERSGTSRRRYPREMSSSSTLRSAVRTTSVSSALDSGAV